MKHKYWFHLQASPHSNDNHFSRTYTPRPSTNSSFFPSTNKPEKPPKKVPQKSFGYDQQVLLRKYYEYIQKLNQIVKTLKKMDSFYQVLLESESFGEITPRCFRHNSEVILYSEREHACLCAQCKYGTFKQRSTNNSKYEQVVQLHHAMSRIQSDNHSSSYKLKTEIGRINVSLKSWRNMNEQFVKIRRSFNEKLEKLYDTEMKNLSNKYLKVKQKMAFISDKYEAGLLKIIQDLDWLKNNSEPKKFILPIIKHLWFGQIHKLFYKENEKKEDFLDGVEVKIIEDLKKVIQKNYKTAFIQVIQVKK